MRRERVRILSAKWRVLHTTMEVDSNMATTVILAIVVLHNYVLCMEPFNSEESLEVWLPNTERDDSHAFRGRTALLSSWIRDQFCHYFQSAGAVPWQNV